MATKKCSVCGIEKQRDEFNNHRVSRDGKHPQCRKCQQIRRKVSYVKNRAHELQRMQQRHAALKHDLTYVLSIRLDSSRRRAQRFGWPCDITLEYLQEIYEKAPYCSLTRKTFDLTQKRLTISIDRIDPARGYVSGNVRLISYHANVARNAFGDAALYELARDLLQHAPASDDTIPA